MCNKKSIFYWDGHMTQKYFFELTFRRVSFNNNTACREGSLMKEYKTGISGTSSMLMVGLFPLVSRVLPWSFAARMFKNTGEKILSDIKALPQGAMDKPVTLQRIVGSEGQYNSWSLAMVLRHLEMINEAAGEIIEELAHGNQPDVEYSQERFNPWDNPGSLKEFEGSLFVFNMRIKRCVTRNTVLQFPHPDLGMLNASQWLVFSALHQWLYQRHIKSVIEKLQGTE